MSKSFAWSWSAYEAYELCPRKYYETRIAKSVQEGKSPQIIWGEQVHKALEDAVEIGKPLPESMLQFQPVLDKLLNTKGTVYTELKMAVTKAKEPTTFFSQLAWCRGVCDWLSINGNKAIALDYKTGKRKVGSQQLQLMALMILAMNKEVEEVFSGFVWLGDATRIDSGTFLRSDSEKLWSDFMPVVRQMEESFKNNFWPEKKNGLCKDWCPVVTCRYNGRKAI